MGVECPPRDTASVFGCHRGHSHACPVHCAAWRPQSGVAAQQQAMRTRRQHRRAGAWACPRGQRATGHPQAPRDMAGQLSVGEGAACTRASQLRGMFPEVTRPLPLDHRALGARGAPDRHTSDFILFCFSLQLLEFDKELSVFKDRLYELDISFPPR